MMIYDRTVLIVLVLIGMGVAEAWGQDSLDSASDDEAAAAAVVMPSSHDTHATLGGWASDRRLQLLDRRHEFGDQFYDRGAFRYMTRRTDREYAIDMVSYRYSPIQDRAWDRVNTGMRVRMGSISRTTWAFLAEIKHTAQLAPDHALDVDAVLQQDGRSQRAFLEFSYDWEIVPRHHVGVRHTVTQYKPDLDASLFYRYRNERFGTARVEMTVLDPYNDFLYKVLGVEEEEHPYTRFYRNQPYLAQLSLASPHRHSLRGEFHVGWQPRGTLVVQKQADESVRYRDRNRAHYLGALVEYDLGWGTTGLLYQRTRSFLDRRGLRSGFTSAYWTEQRFHRGGGFFISSWRNLRGEVWGFWGDYSDHQNGSDFTRSTLNDELHWIESRKQYRARLSYVPEPTGVYAAVEYNALTRRLNFDASNQLANEWSRNWFWLGPSNYRGTAMLGYRFGKGAVLLGMNYDFDGDVHELQKKEARFDNGFFRFSLSW